MTTTPTLGLTQFEATDTINFLTQYNTDLSKIDTNAKMTKAIGSDYIYSYTTPPSYTGSTVTLYASTNYIPAYGRDTNGDIKQTIYTLSTNKTISLTGTNDYDIYIDETQTMSSVLTSNFNIVSFVAELPTTVATTATYVYYVVNEHRYYYTSGSTTASWASRIYCKVASVRVASSAITYFKPNLQLNLAQKIGKDKLLMTMAEVNANTDKEFVPSAVAVKEFVDSVAYSTSGIFKKRTIGGVRETEFVSSHTITGTYSSSTNFYFSVITVQLPVGYEIANSANAVVVATPENSGLFFVTYVGYTSATRTLTFNIGTGASYTSYPTKLDVRIKEYL